MGMGRCLGAGLFGEEVFGINARRLGMVSRIIIRAVLDFIVEQVNEGDEEKDVNQAEENDGKDDLIGLHSPREAIRCHQEIIDDPGLATEFGREPSRLIGYLRAENGKYQQPEECPDGREIRAEEQSFPKQDQRQKGDAEERRAHDDHDMVELEGDSHHRPVAGTNLGDREKKFNPIASISKSAN